MKERGQSHTDIVQGIEYSEDVQSVLYCFLTEVIDGIVAASLQPANQLEQYLNLRVACITDSISTTNEGLEWNVGNQSP